MKTETQASLDKSREFLNECVETSHLLLKRKLEALRRGEDIDWRETRDIVREGRTAARQLTQIASLEIRDQKQDARREKPRRVPPANLPPLKVQPTPEMAVRFLNGVMEWQKMPAQGNYAPPMPADLRALIVELGLDPDNMDSFEALFNHFEAMTGRIAA